MVNSPKYPFKVKLVGINGNVFNIIGKCANEMKKNKCSQDEQQEFLDKAMSCPDYDSVLRLCLEYFEVV